MDYKEIGARIREARRAAGMTQEALAEAAELSVGYIRQLEYNMKCARISSLLRIADALNISLVQLFTDGQAINGTFLALFDDCTEDEGQILYDMAQALKQSLREHWRA